MLLEELGMLNKEERQNGEQEEQDGQLEGYILSTLHVSLVDAGIYQ